MDPSPPADGGDSGRSSTSIGRSLLRAVVAIVGSVGYVVSAYLIAVLAGIALFLVLVPVVLLSGVPEGGGLESLAVVLVATETFLLGVGASVLAVISIRVGWVSRRDLGLSMPTERQVLVSLAVAAGLVLVASGFEFLAQFAGVEPSEHALLEEEPGAIMFFALVPVAIVLIGPVEELLFRGLIQNFVRSGLGPAGGVVWTSLVFATVHLPAYFIAEVPLDAAVASLGIVFVVSLALGWLYERQRNLPVVALVHGVYDAILFTLAGLAAL